MPSIRKRGAKFMVIYRDQYGVQRSAGSFASYTEATRTLSSVLDGPATIKSYPATNLASYAPGWLAGHQLEASSHHNYLGSLRTWIVPYLGSASVGSITKADVRTWLRQIQADGAGIPAIHKSFIVLSALLHTAADDSIISVNPCKNIKLPPMPKKIRRIITHDEYQNLISEIPVRFKPIVQAAIGTGARFGECLALSPEDLDGEFLHITKSVSYGKIKYPKNAEHRKVKITAFLTEIIRSFPDYSKQDPANFRTQVWHPACKRAGIKDFTFHDLRHTHASWLLANGCDLQTLKERLGHHSLKTTQLYLHTLPTSQDTALAALERAMGS